MTSKDLQGFSAWVSFSRRGIEGAHNKAGAYVIRTCAGKLFGRLNGSSDIVYIGRASQLRRRLKQHLNPRYDERDIASILKRIQSDFGPLDVSWKESGDTAKAKLEETKLLEKYLSDHIELPPLNRQETGWRSRVVLRLFNEAKPEEQKQVLEWLKRQIDAKRGVSS
jgi:hypothetical protein